MGPGGLHESFCTVFCWSLRQTWGVSGGLWTPLPPQTPPHPSGQGDIGSRNPALEGTSSTLEGDSEGVQTNLEGRCTLNSGTVSFIWKWQCVFRGKGGQVPFSKMKIVHFLAFGVKARATKRPQNAKKAVENAIFSVKSKSRWCGGPKFQNSFRFWTTDMGGNSM